MYQIDETKHNRTLERVQWWSMPGGRRVQAQLQLLLDSHLPECFGYYGIALGPLATSLDLSSSPVAKIFNLQSSYDKSVDGIIDYDALPIASDSVDLVVIPHILDVIERPHELLRELSRVMIPDGKLIISGVNPLSWFGIKHLARKATKKEVYARRLIGLVRLLDWMKLLGFDVEHYQGLEPANKVTPSFLSPFMSHFQSHYFMVASKEVSTLTPIRPSWRKNAKLVPARFAEPSVRQQVERVIQKVSG